MSTIIDQEYLEKYAGREYMETYTGKMFSVMEPKLGDINIFDVAHALAFKCRYNGHCKHYFSVAEHCVMLAQLARHKGLPVDVQFQLLMHDAGETYVPDTPRPMKHLFPDLVVMEKILDGLVRQRFGLSDIVPQVVKDWDSRILVDERKSVMMPSRNRWVIDDLEPLRVIFPGWDPLTAEVQFLQAYQTIAAEYHREPVLLAYTQGQFGQGLRDGRVSVPDYQMIDLLGGCAAIYPENPAGEVHFEHGDFTIHRAPALGAPGA